MTYFLLAIMILFLVGTDLMQTIVRTRSVPFWYDNIIKLICVFIVKKV